MEYTELALLLVNSTKYVGLTYGVHWIGTAASELYKTPCGTDWPTNPINSMQQSPSWEASWFSANKEIRRLYGTWKVHYCIYKFPPPVPILELGQPRSMPTDLTSW